MNGIAQSLDYMPTLFGPLAVLDGREAFLFATISALIPTRPPLTIIELADNFGQYVINIRCECGHSRTARPQIFAAMAGWDALLADVVKRLRCTKCGKRKCSATVRHEHKRDG